MEQPLNEAEDALEALGLLRVDVIMVCLIVLSLICTLFEYLFIWLEKSVTGAWRY